MVDRTTSLDETLALALKLSPLDKVRLLERIASSLEKEMIEPASTPDLEMTPTWTDEEIRELLAVKRITPAELVAWLNTNPPAQAWGDLKDDEDAADYIHRLRHSFIRRT